ncbi:hypothetical protein QWZ13_09265 [Reinekea marina]|uniref:hypothetical protein n=1 Tax=Reinekea marina TaxID=1310421 RepID=UPI0025B4A189|nr:hypothetical protein [Reinekea marina]MDN3649097.1 hypothetical protein [Reinekea marina]
MSPLKRPTKAKQAIYINLEALNRVFNASFLKFRLLECYFLDRRCNVGLNLKYFAPNC